MYKERKLKWLKSHLFYHPGLTYFHEPSLHSPRLANTNTNPKSTQRPKRITKKTTLAHIPCKVYNMDNCEEPMF